MTDGRVGRRALLLGGLTGVGGLVAGCRDGAPSASSAHASATSAHATATSASASASSAGRVDWGRLRRHLSGSLARPGDAAYDGVRLVENPRYDTARPLAVASVASAQDVATTLAFAQDHGLPVAIRSGGHSYPGWSAGDGRLVVDVRPLHRVTTSGTTATIGAGASLAQVYGALGTRGRGIAGGSCPTVGIAGLTQGGGVGVLTRAHGLTCDSVTAMQVVTADGQVRTVRGDDDLFWALRGGGGGHLGVVTSLTTTTFAAPTITRAYLAWPMTAADQVVPAFLAGVPGADRRLWATLKVLGGQVHPTGPVLFASVTWTGAPGGLDRALRPWLAAVPAPTTDSRHTAGYLDTMLTYAGCSTIPVDRCHTGPDGDLQREAFAATSHVVTTTDTDVGAMLERVDLARQAGLKEAGISLDALGGAVDDLGDTDTAFGHRGALATVQYTATFTSPTLARAATAYVRDFREAMTPSWGHGAYVNYADASLRGYRSAYFGGNAARLADVRRGYDPDGFFTQPQDF